MNRWFLLLLSIAWTLVTTPPLLAADPDQEKLQGKWTVESFDYDGAAVESMLSAVREFKDDKYTLTQKSGDVIQGVIKLDSTKTPKLIDLEFNGQTAKGIYVLDGDKLRMCYRLGDGPRPTEFASAAGSMTVLAVHKKN